MLGPIFVDITGLELSSEEETYLQHPAVGGVVLFARNYQSPQQLQRLCEQIHALRDPALIIAVDHEGGRVQRFLEGFTHLPPMAELGDSYQQDAAAALLQAEQLGFTMASELKHCGVDLSFAPVLDLNKGISQVLQGGRAISAEVDAVVAIAKAYIKGMHLAGMVATGKHFPGHGSVELDSHLDLPVDARSYAKIAGDDMQVFQRLLPELQAIMPAHIIFSAVDSKPASLSRYWLQDILRQKLAFKGIIISDCLSMQGAVKIAPDLTERVGLALNAGCDIVLVCNTQAALAGLLTNIQLAMSDQISNKVELLRHYRG